MRRGHGGMRRPRSAGVSLETAPEPHIPVSLSPPCHLPATTLGTVTPEASPVCHRGRGEAGGKRVSPPHSPVPWPMSRRGRGVAASPSPWGHRGASTGGSWRGRGRAGGGGGGSGCAPEGRGDAAGHKSPPHGLPPRWQQGLRGTGPSPRRCASEKRARNLWGGDFGDIGGTFGEVRGTGGGAGSGGRRQGSGRGQGAREGGSARRRGAKEAPNGSRRASI